MSKDSNIQDLPIYAPSPPLKSTIPITTYIIKEEERTKEEENKDTTLDREKISTRTVVREFITNIDGVFHIDDIMNIKHSKYK